MSDRQFDLLTLTSTLPYGENIEEEEEPIEVRSEVEHSTLSIVPSSEANSDLNTTGEKNSSSDARESVKEILASLEEKNPEIFVSMKAAFSNIHTETFFGVK